MCTTQVVLVAKSNITTGEEVTDCNGGIHHLFMPPEARQMQLCKRYTYDCACAGCHKDLFMLPGLPTSIRAKVAVGFHFEQVRHGEH